MWIKLFEHVFLINHKCKHLFGTQCVSLLSPSITKVTESAQ